MSTEGEFSRKFPARRRVACKLAARERRSIEAELVYELGRALALPGGNGGTERSKLKSQDKIAVLRLAVAELKLRKVFGGGDGTALLRGSVAGLHEDPGALLHDGFLVVISANGQLLHVSNSVHEALCLRSWEMTGKNMYEYADPEDWSDLDHLLKQQPREGRGQHRSALVRLRSNQLPDLRFGFTTTTKPIQFTGNLRTGSDGAPIFVGVGRPIPHPTASCTFPQYVLDSSRAFTSIVSVLDANTIVNIDARVQQLWGYTPAELCGQRSWEYVYPGDAKTLMQGIQELHDKGQNETPPIRVLTRSGGLVLVIFQATTIYTKTGSGEGQQPTAIVIRQYTVGELGPEQVRHMPTGFELRRNGANTSLSKSPSTESQQDYEAWRLFQECLYSDCDYQNLYNSGNNMLDKDSFPVDSLDFPTGSWANEFEFC